jgi:hypothetical protein
VPIHRMQRFVPLDFCEWDGSNSKEAEERSKPDLEQIADFQYLRRIDRGRAWLCTILGFYG